MELPTIPEMEIIDNAKPSRAMLCHKKPKPSSTLTIIYDGKDKLLELFV